MTTCELINVEQRNCETCLYAEDSTLNPGYPYTCNLQPSSTLLLCIATHTCNEFRHVLICDQCRYREPVSPSMHVYTTGHDDKTYQLELKPSVCVKNNDKRLVLNVRHCDTFLPNQHVDNVRVCIARIAQRWVW